MKKLLLIRFFLKPISLGPNPNSLISQTAFSINHPSCIRRCLYVTPEHNPAISDKNVEFRNMSYAPMSKRIPIDTPNVSPKMISQVIDVVRSTKGACRSELDLIDIRLSKHSVYEIFRVLSCERLPGLQFFEWIRDHNLDLYRSADVCSLIIDNCGWLDDYDTMTVLLKRFKDEKICLTDKAFLFLPVLDSSKDNAMKSLAFIIDILKNVGGSVCNSGIHAMINMLCAINSFDLAKFVIGLTEEKLSYYGVLVREKCRRGCSSEAYSLLGEMRVAGCEPDLKMYNYILGSLCKSDKISEALSLLEEMKDMGVESDAITLEVFVASLCGRGRMEFANEILMKMLHLGYTPRLSTHVALVKGYFNAGRYEEAYKYVCDIEVKYMLVANKMYSVLARLHQKKGNIDVAQRIFSEMMEKGLKPDHLCYQKTVKVLRHTGSNTVAQDLVKKFSEFKVK